MKNDQTLGIKIALLLMLITFIYLFSVTFFVMPEGGKEQAKTIVPFLLGSIFGTLMGFYWGNKHKEPGDITLPPVASDDIAKAAAAALEAERIEAAKTLADEAERSRLAAAKETADKVIETAKVVETDKVEPKLKEE
jgi:hypothetical protein